MGILRSILAVFDLKVEGHGELKKGHDETKSFIGTLNHLGRTMAEVFVFHEIYEFVEGIVETSSALERMSIKTGVATDELQQLQYAAFQADVGADALGTSMAKLSRALVAAKGAKIEGIDTKDINGTKSAAEFLPEIADKFQSLTNVSDKTALAMKLFGKSGVEMLPMLSKGSAGIRDMMMEAKELGGGLSEDAIKKSVELEEEAKRLSFAFTGLKSEIASGIMPILRELVSYATHAMVSFRKWTAHTEIIKAAFTGFALKGVVMLTHHLGGLRGVFGLLRKSIMEVLIPIYALEDFIVFMAGGKSALGFGLDKMFGEGTSGKVRDQINELVASLEGFGAKISAFIGSPTGIKTLTVLFGTLGAFRFAGLISSMNPLMKSLGLMAAAIGLVVDQWERLKAIAPKSEEQMDMDAKERAGITPSVANDAHRTEGAGLLDKIPWLKQLKDTFGPGAGIAAEREATVKRQREKEAAEPKEPPKLPAAQPVDEQGRQLATAPMPATTTTVVNAENHSKNTIQVIVPEGTDRDVAERVAGGAERGVVRGMDLSATKAALVPGAG